MRFMLADFLGLTLDAQYMRDRYEVEDHVEGFVLGARMAAEFLGVLGRYAHGAPVKPVSTGRYTSLSTA
jgi:hypothetical protein